MHKAFALVLLLLPVLFLACGAPPEPEPEAEPAGERVENPAVGVAIAAVPPMLEVVANEGDRLELVPRGMEGMITVEATEPEKGGINLVAAHREHEEAIKEAGGTYSGRTELGSQFGTAFLSRGRYEVAGEGLIEESVIFIVHPWDDRKLKLVYRYPAGTAEESKERVEGQLFELLAELEALPAPAEEAS